MGKRTMVNRCVRGGGASAFGYSGSGARTVPPALNPYGSASGKAATAPSTLLGLQLRKDAAPTAWYSASDRRRRPRVLPRRGRRGGRCAGS